MLREIGISAAKIVLFLVLWGALVAAVTLSVIHLGGDGFYKSMPWRIAAEGGALLATLAALLVMALIADKRGFDTLGFPATGAAAGLIGGTLIGCAIFAVPVGILGTLGYLRFAPDFTQFSWNALGLALLLVAVNTADQELLVRSYIFQEIRRKYSGAAAVTVTTILFVALHTGAILQGTAGLLAGVNVALASVLLGIAYLRSGALWLPIGIHFGWNAFQGPVLGIAVTGTDLGAHWHAFAANGPALWTGGAMGVEGGLAGLAGPLLGIAIVRTLYPRVRA